MNKGKDKDDLYTAQTFLNGRIALSTLQSTVKEIKYDTIIQYHYDMLEGM